MKKMKKAIIGQENSISSFFGMEAGNSILEAGPGTISKLVMWQPGVRGYIRDKAGEVSRGQVKEDFYDIQKGLRW